MISIVVCSINPAFVEQLKKNIDSTIQVEYEMLVWDNRGINKGICEVYNIMAGKAKFEIICFLHEDIVFKTENWGTILQEIFETMPGVGLIGVAGSKYKSKAFSGWYTGIDKYDCANIIHEIHTEEQRILLPNPVKNEWEEVVDLDGVFLCCRKSIWEKIKFNQEDIKGFHFYDLDFSLRASKISKVIVTYNVLIKHITQGGDFGNYWMLEAIKFHQKNNFELPIRLFKDGQKNEESKIVITALNVLKSQKISWKIKWRWITTQNLLKYPKYYYAILKLFFYRPLGLKNIHNIFRKK